MIELAFVLLLPIFWCVNFYFKIIDLNWWRQLILAKRINNFLTNNKRLVYDSASNDLAKVGFVPSKEALKLERPGHNKNEEIKIIGFNSKGQSLVIDFHWQPKSDGTAVSAFNLQFEDENKNKFTANGIDLVQNPQNNSEYKAKGLCLEVLQPFKRLRIRFRGFLQKNDGENSTKELIFANFKLLWLPTSNVFDYQCDHNPGFIAKEVVKSTTIFGKIPNFENRVEQFGQIKGTIQLRDGNESELYLWGSRSKRFDEKQEMRVRRLFGYTQKGLAFHVGIAYDLFNFFKYRYGVVYNGKFKSTAIKSVTGDCSLDEEMPDKMCFTLETSKKYEIKVTRKSDLLEVNVNGIKGRAMQWLDDEFPKLTTSLNKHWPCQLMSKNLVVPIESEEAEKQMTSGGKGASLALLTVLSKKLIYKNDKFIVPKGIIVTTNAYQLILTCHQSIKKAIKEVEKSINDATKLKEKCSTLTQMISSTSMPIEIRNNIKNLLNELYQQNNNNEIQFAVRSSAVGEDSEVMSTAGQLTTFLGIKTFDDLCSSVMKCWASQFDVIAVEYKRGYGQEMNQPMAVVIEPMVDCEAAGVMFTCDPISGDQRKVLITANHGLGESVVSAIAEPDTIELDVHVKRLNYEYESDYSVEELSIAGIKSIQIGTKNKMINLSSITEVDETQQKKCCITKETAIRLGQVALKIKDFFGDDRDIEWGIKNGKIYIFQSRPVTNLNTFSEFELIHEYDTGLPSEFEVISRVNVGEVMPKAFSMMGIGFFTFYMSRYYALNKRLIGRPTSEDYYAGLVLDLCFNSYHSFFNLKNTELMKITGTEQSAVTKGMILALFGHPLDDPELNLICSQIAEPEPVFQPIRKLFAVLFSYIKSDYVNEFEQLKQKYDDFDYNKNTSNEYFLMLKHFFENHADEKISHVYTLMINSLLNLIIISCLRTNNDNNPHLYSDFAILVSQCKNLISADFGKQIEKIAKLIAKEGYKESFLKMTNQEAKQFLTNSKSEANKMFLQLLSKHGHRAYFEFDVFAKSLEMDPTPAIDSIRSILKLENQVIIEKEDKSIDELVDSLKTPVNGIKKWLIKKILPLSWSSTRQREMTKSMVILMINSVRKICWSLAETMHKEGRLPEKELLFFLDYNELQELLETRNPILVAKAKRRFKLKQQMETWKFDEICKGYELKPKPVSSQLTYSLGKTLKGTPVSHGQVTARVCVTNK